ncbi:MAG TPA: T9SS type A sorting domain-containing protein, partial [Bacteroidales bacterium]|nr:T9SS type A sorting domain-containing protein [Bacteroidales bacterium]
EVGITATDNRTLRVYPNPVRESFTVELPGKLSSSAMIQIVDMEGRVHFSKQLGSVVQQRSFVNIPVGNLAEGIYIVRLFSDKEQFNTRIVVLK